MTAFKGGRAKAQQRYNSKPEQVKKREGRNKARRLMMKAGKVHKGDGKDVGHKDGNALHNPPNRSNYKVQSKHANRSYPRTRGAHKKNPRD